MLLCNLPRERCLVLLLGEVVVLASFEFDDGNVALGDEVMHLGDLLLGHLRPQALIRKLRLQRRRLAVQSAHRIVQARLLLRCPRLFQIDLLVQRGALSRQSLQHCGVNVAPMAVGLADLDGQQRRTRLDDLPLGHIDRRDQAGVGRKDLRYADGRHQEAGNCFLAGIVAGRQERDRGAHHCRQQPGEWRRCW